MSENPLVQDFATDWDHSDPQWVADPYPIWEDLRERCPVAHTDRYAGGWFPTTHEMVSSVANDTLAATRAGSVVFSATLATPGTRRAKATQTCAGVTP